MIISENIDLNLLKPVNAKGIEKELKNKGIDPLRWAIVNIENNVFTVNVSYIK